MGSQQLSSSREECMRWKESRPDPDDMVGSHLHTISSLIMSSYQHSVVHLELESTLTLTALIFENVVSVFVSNDSDTGGSGCA
jgi:hypothetical protein